MLFTMDYPSKKKPGLTWQTEIHRQAKSCLSHILNYPLAISLTKTTN